MSVFIDTQDIIKAKKQLKSLMGESEYIKWESQYLNNLQKQYSNTLESNAVIKKVIISKIDFEIIQHILQEKKMEETLLSEELSHYQDWLKEFYLTLTKPEVEKNKTLPDKIHLAVKKLESVLDKYLHILNELIDHVIYMKTKVDALVKRHDEELELEINATLKQAGSVLVHLQPRDTDNHEFSNHTREFLMHLDNLHKEREEIKPHHIDDIIHSFENLLNLGDIEKGFEHSIQEFSQGLKSLTTLLNVSNHLRNIQSELSHVFAGLNTEKNSVQNTKKTLFDKHHTHTADDTFKHFSDNTSKHLSVLGASLQKHEENIAKHDFHPHKVKSFLDHKSFDDNDKKDENSQRLKR